MLFLIILLLTFGASYVFPWWIAVIIAFIAGWWYNKTPWASFLSGFGAVAIVWAVLAVMKSLPNNNLLAGRVAVLFHLPNWTTVLLITVLIGGIVGGMAALSGTLVRNAFKK